MQRIFITLTALAALGMTDAAFADNCGKWQSKLNSTQRKLNNGGNQSQIRQWIKERNYYASVLDKCNKKSGNYRWIATSSGKGNQQLQRHAREKLRPINTDNPQLRQMIETCNYWIAQYNQNATDVNRTFKNTACLQAEKTAQNIRLTPENTAGATSNAAPAAKPSPKRSLNACIKPHNQIDEDVNRCMQGEMTPD